MAIRQGPAGANGPASISVFEFPEPPPPFQYGSGSGALAGPPWVFGPLEGDLRIAVERLVNSPEDFFLQIGTAANPAGALRAQMGPVVRTPVLQSVMSATLDAVSASVAPGGLITIFGSDLAKVGTSLRGWQGSTVPNSLNNAVVEVGRRRAALAAEALESSAAPGFPGVYRTSVRMPPGVTAGTRPVILRAGETGSNTVNLSVR
jgi:hypothetical protein